MQAKIAEGKRQNGGNGLAHEATLLVSWVEFVANFAVMITRIEVPERNHADQPIFTRERHAPCHIFAPPIRLVQALNPAQTVIERLVRLLSVMLRHLRVRFNRKQRFSIAWLKLAQMQTL